MKDHREDYANRAEQAITGYANNSVLANAITDILGDLCHLMAREGMDYNEYFRDADIAYGDEVMPTRDKNIIRASNKN